MRNTRLDNVIALAGRKGSEKTTMMRQLLDELSARGILVSSVEECGTSDLEIEVRGTTSSQHHETGTIASAFTSAERCALLEKIAPPEEEEVDLTDVDALLRRPDDRRNVRQRCLRAISMLPASNLVLVDGFVDADLATIELFCEANGRDRDAAPRFIEQLNAHAMTGTMSSEHASSLPAAVVTDMPEVASAALTVGLPCFGLYDIAQIATWLIDTFVKPLLTVAISCDSESRRISGSKALVPFHGKPLIEHMLARFAPIAADMVVVTNEPDELTYLQIRYPGLRITSNKFKKRGGLPDFITALEEARCPAVAMIACDLADASTELIEHEAELLATSQRTELFLPFDAVVPMDVHGFEAFCGVYQKDRCLDAARACFGRGKVQMKLMLDDLNVRIIDMNDESLCPHGCFARVESPDGSK